MKNNLNRSVITLLMAAAAITPNPIWSNPAPKIPDDLYGGVHPVPTMPPLQPLPPQPLPTFPHIHLPHVTLPHCHLRHGHLLPSCTAPKVFSPQANTPDPTWPGPISDWSAHAD